MSAGLSFATASLALLLGGAGDAGVSTPAAPPADRVHFRKAPAPVAALREAVPPPLRFGEFSPQLGSWVDFRTGTGKGTRARLAHVADVTVEEKAVHQLELEFPDDSAAPRMAFWVTTSPTFVILRMALWSPPAAPLSVPLDTPLLIPEVRGEPAEKGEVAVPAPFAGKGRTVEFVEGGQTLATVVRAAVPLVGVSSVRTPAETWTAIATGKGATRGFAAVPIEIPRLLKEGP